MAEKIYRCEQCREIFPSSAAEHSILYHVGDEDKEFKQEVLSFVQTELSSFQHSQERIAKWLHLDLMDGWYDSQSMVKMVATNMVVKYVDFWWPSKDLPQNSRSLIEHLVRRELDGRLSASNSRKQ